MSDYADNDRGRRPRFAREDEPVYERRVASNGMATAALVLGVISLCLGFFAGIPAIICGLVGISRANRVGGVGQGPAITGLILGGVGTLLNTAIMIALLLPAVQKVREAAARTTDMNNLKQIDLAHHTFEAAHGKLAPAFVLDDNGQPNRGLSWRVSMLPYIEQDAVYRMFDRSQPWNSATNMQASGLVLKVYLSPSDSIMDNQTRYRVFVGPGTLFEDSPEWLQERSLTKIPDGTSTTLMVVETADRVPWAAYQEIPYQPGGPLPKLGNPSRSTFMAGFADGSVRALRTDISPQVLHALITRNGGEVVPPNFDR